MKHASHAKSNPAPRQSQAQVYAASRAFTLIEILICMALFAVGFAAVASLLPAGVLLERQIMSSTDAAITGRNSLEVMKGKGMHALTYELMPRMSSLIGYAAGPNGPGRVLPVNYQALRSASTSPFSKSSVVDMETRVNSSGVSPCQFHADYSLLNFWDTNGDGIGYGNATPVPTSNWISTNDQDRTDWANGRIHALKNRPMPFFTLGYCSPLDCSYPSSVLDIAARTYMTHLMFSNESQTPLAGDLISPDPSSFSFVLTGITVRIGQGLQWPEQVEGDPTSPGCWMPPSGPNSNQGGGTVGATAIMSNAPHQMRSATGGNPAGNSFDMGYCNSWFVYHSTTDLAPGWNWMDVGYLGFMNATQPDASGRYSLPAPVNVLAISYNKSRDLVLLRYPQAYARTPATASNTALNTYRSSNNITAANWVDRRLKKGDTFMSGSHSYVFHVVNVLDAQAELSKLSGGLQSGVDWSDGTYQIVQVTPPLANTLYTDNLPLPPIWPNPPLSLWSSPSLASAIVCPPAITGGPSPWMATCQLVAGSPREPQVPRALGDNNIVFHAFANLAE